MAHSSLIFQRCFRFSLSDPWMHFCCIFLVVSLMFEHGSIRAALSDLKKKMARQAASAAEDEAGQLASAAVFPPTHLLMMKSEFVRMEFVLAESRSASGNNV